MSRPRTFAHTVAAVALATLATASSAAAQSPTAPTIRIAPAPPHGPNPQVKVTSSGPGIVNIRYAVKQKRGSATIQKTIGRSYTSFTAAGSQVSLVELTYAGQPAFKQGNGKLHLTAFISAVAAYNAPSVQTKTQLVLRAKTTGHPKITS